MEAFLKLESVSKYFQIKKEKKKTPRKHVFFLSDHALVGHVIQTTVVADEFECQLKCIANNSCKSINVHPGDSNSPRGGNPSYR